MKKIFLGFIITLFCVVFAGTAFPQAEPNTPYKLGQSKMLRQDAETNAITGITFAEDRLHSGKHFFSKSSAEYVDASVTDLVFTTPDNDTRIYASAGFTADSVFTITLHEAVTFTGGTPIVTFNNDRNSSISPELISLSGATITDTGTQIWAGRVTGSIFSGITGGLGYDILAKPDTNYLFRITKFAGENGFLDTNFYWYEY